MYIPKKPGNRKKQPPKPKQNRAQLAKNGRKLDTFTVKSGPGLKISGFHKFNIFKRENRIVVEYCEPCSRARQWLNIDGKKLNYVQAALKSYPGQSPTGFDLAKIKSDFTQLLKKEYLRFNPRIN